MNNERYLFRGKRIDTGEWIFGWLVKDILTGSMFIQQSTFETTEDRGDQITTHISRNVNEETIGQFTGITDKNGVKVFEGDKIKHPKATEPEHLGWTIEWYDFKWIGRNNFNPKFTCVLSDYFTQCEVIGNIFDNDKAVNQ